MDLTELPNAGTQRWGIREERQASINPRRQRPRSGRGGLLFVPVSTEIWFNSISAGCHISYRNSTRKEAGWTHLEREDLIGGVREEARSRSLCQSSLPLLPSGPTVPLYSTLTPPRKPLVAAQGTRRTHPRPSQIQIIRDAIILHCTSNDAGNHVYVSRFA